MIARISGTVVERSATELVVDCGGVGYAVAVTIATSEKYPAGSECTLQTYLAVREDAMQLFGFISRNERELFLLLISVSGIGAKTALAILSATGLGELRDAIVSESTSVLQRLPGVGRKTAERIVLELRDKIQLLEIESPGSKPISGSAHVQQDTIAALMALGYSRQVAEKAIRAAVAEFPAESSSTDKLLRAALKCMS